MALHITEQASKQAKSLIEEYGFIGLRLSVAVAGCAGFEYLLDGAVKEETDDLVNEEHGVKIFCDKRSYLFLNETTIDYASNLMHNGFIFLNPNAKGTCGCSKSFSM